MRLDLFDDQLADLHLPVRIGGDAALLQALQHLAITSGSVDSTFIDASTSGYDALFNARQDVDWTRVQSRYRSLQSIHRGRCLNAQREPGNHRMLGHGLDATSQWGGRYQEVVNLLLLGGHIGREGAGLCPVRGHSNVQVTEPWEFGRRPARNYSPP